MPFTTAIVVATALHFVVNFYTNGFLYSNGIFSCIVPLGGINTHYWTLLTYPVAETQLLGVLMLGVWMWSLGGSLERSWGTPAFARFFCMVTLATSLSVWVGGLILNYPGFVLHGLNLPLVGLSVAWAAINPYEELLFFFVIKMKAWQFAALIVILMLFITFSIAPPLGLFALVNPLLAYAWVRGGYAYGLQGGFVPRRPASRRGPDLRIYDADKQGRPAVNRPNRNVPLDDLKGTSKRGLIGVYKDWQQRKRLEKLWKASGLSDSKDERPKR